MFAMNFLQYSQTSIMMYWKTLTTFDPFDETTYFIQFHLEIIYLIFSWLLFFLYFYTIFSAADNKLRNFNTVLDEENDELVHKNEMMENILLEIRSILKADERSARKITKINNILDKMESIERMW
jgi:hypothetical protein